MFSGEGWPHVEGDSNRGVLKIEQFCSEEHKYNFLSSELWVKCIPFPDVCLHLRIKKREFAKMLCFTLQLFVTHLLYFRNK